MPMGLADPATLSAFRLDKYEVTVGRVPPFRPRLEPWRRLRPPVGSGKHSHLNAGLGLANSAKAGAYELGWIDSDDKRIAPTDDNLGLCGAYATWTPSPASQENLPINCVNWWEANAFCIYDGGFLPTEAEWKYAAAGGSEQRRFPWAAPSRELTINTRSTAAATPRAPAVAAMTGARGRGTSRRWERRVRAPDSGAS